MKDKSEFGKRFAAHITHKGWGSIIYKELLQINKKRIKTQHMKLPLIHPTETREDGFGLGRVARQTSNVNTEPLCAQREADVVTLNTLQGGDVSS